MSGKSYTYSQVVDAVLKFGSNQWYSIGLQLGYDDGEINSATFDKPTSAGKLQAIINWKASAVGDEELAELLLKVCGTIPHPIIGRVKQYLDRSCDPKAGVVTTEGSVPGIQKSGDQIGVLIVTATAIEYEAIIEFLQKVSGPKQLEDNPLPYHGGHELGCRVARWNPGKGRSPMIVGVVQQTEQGQRGTDEIVSIIKDAVERKRIAKNGLVAMIGMCAGNEKLVRLGDVLVPWEISALEVLGKMTVDGYTPRATLAALPTGLRTAVQRAAQNANAALKIRSGQGQGTWLDTIPDKFKGTEPSPRDVPSRYLYTVPSPRYLYDVTLFQLQQYLVEKKADKCSISELHNHIMEQYKWPELINKKILKEALEHSKSLDYIEVDTSQSKKQFSVNSKGRDHLETMSDEEDVFPRADHDPKIRWDAPVVMGQHVDKSLTSDKAWNKLAHDACQVKVYGYEMEGYAFLKGMQGVGCETLTPLFIKTVADFGTEDYKMKDRYYQEYATTVAAAFLFHFLTDCRPESWQQ